MKDDRKLRKKKAYQLNGLLKRLSRQFPDEIDLVYACLQVMGIENEVIMVGGTFVPANDAVDDFWYDWVELSYEFPPEVQDELAGQISFSELLDSKPSQDKPKYTAYLQALGMKVGQIMIGGKFVPADSEVLYFWNNWLEFSYYLPERILSAKIAESLYPWGGEADNMLQTNPRHFDTEMKGLNLLKLMYKLEPRYSYKNGRRYREYQVVSLDPLDITFQS